MNHSEEEKRLRHKAVREFLKTHLTIYKKITSTTWSETSGLLSFDQEGTNSIAPKTRRGCTSSSKTYLTNGVDELSREEVEILKDRLVDGINIGELLVHPNTMVREISRTITTYLSGYSNPER